MTMSEEESEEFQILRDGIRVRRDAMERNENLNEFRRALARIIKPTALFASVTPYDAALGDLAYAAGELLDPEGDPELAALAASTGLLTGGAGSGAMAARMAGRSAKSKKAKDLLADHPTERDRIKNLDPNARLPPTVDEQIKEARKVLTPNPNPKTFSEKATNLLKRIDRQKLEKEADRFEKIKKDTRDRRRASKILQSTGATARTYAGDKIQNNLNEEDNKSITDEMIIDYMLSNNIRF